MRSFEILYSRYKRKIYGYAYQMLRNSAQAEDCAQEIFIRLHDKASQYRPVAKFSTWFYRLAQNLIRDHLRRRVRRAEVDLDAPVGDGGEGASSHADRLADPALGPSQSADNLQLLNALQQALGQLDADDREAVTLCDINGVGHEEAAKVLGVKTGTLTVRIFRARKKLADIMGGFSGGDHA